MDISCLEDWLAKPSTPQVVPPSSDNASAVENITHSLVHVFKEGPAPVCMGQ